MHTAHCARNITLCTICKEPFPKSSIEVHKKDCEAESKRKNEQQSRNATRFSPSKFQIRQSSYSQSNVAESFRSKGTLNELKERKIESRRENEQRQKENDRRDRQYESKEWQGNLRDRQSDSRNRQNDLRNRQIDLGARESEMRDRKFEGRDSQIESRKSETRERQNTSSFQKQSSIRKESVTFAEDTTKQKQNSLNSVKNMVYRSENLDGAKAKATSMLACKYCDLGK